MYYKCTSKQLNGLLVDLVPIHKPLVQSAHSGLVITIIVQVIVMTHTKITTGVNDTR